MSRGVVAVPPRYVDGHRWRVLMRYPSSSTRPRGPQEGQRPQGAGRFARQPAWHHRHGGLLRRIHLERRLRGLNAPGDEARQTGRRGRLAQALRAESGFSMIEVLISSLMLSIVVMGTLNGIDTTSHAAALGRARAQADSFAEQDEERLRSFSIKHLEELEAKGGETYTMEADHSKYSVSSSVRFINNATGTSSCSNEKTPQASYYETRSEVAWTGAKKEGGGPKPVRETSVIAPPPGASLIVQVQNAEAEGVRNMSVTVEGPGEGGTIYNDTTSVLGCSIFSSFPEGGEYSVDVQRSGYVDKNWYAKSEEDPSVQSEYNLVEGLTTKAPYEFDEAGQIKPRLVTVPVEAATETNTTPPAQLPGEALNVVAVNGNFSPGNPFKTVLEKNSSGPLTSMTSGFRVFPFPTGYSVFAGTCKANEPKNFGLENPPATIVHRGETAAPEVKEPAMIVRVFEHTRAEEESWVNTSHHEPRMVSKPITLVNRSGEGTTEGCDNQRYQPQTLPATIEEGGVTRTENFSPERGLLEFPGQPYGKYVVCAEVSAGKFIYQGEVNNNRPNAITGSGTFPSPLHEDGRLVSLYMGYTTSNPAPAELHQGEGSECPLT